MRTANNNFTVEGLVAKYRNYVKEHCPKEYVVGEGNDGKMAEDYIPFSPDGNSDEQLLVTLYHMVCGDGAEKEILTALAKYEEKFYKDALSSEELTFLCDCFQEVVSYEFEHRRDWLFHSAQYISKERVRLVHEYVKPQKGSTVFIADTEYCDLAVQFPGCIVKGFTGYNYQQKEVWALGQIRMFAAGIKSDVVSGDEINGEYTYELPEKGSVDVVILRANECKFFAQKIFGTMCANIEALYNLLKPNGKMLFFSEFQSEMAGNVAGKTNHAVFDFRTNMLREKAISSIVAYEDKALLGNGKSNYILLVLSRKENNTISIKDEGRHISKEIRSEYIDGDILWPSYYIANRPQYGVPLSSVVKLAKEEELAEFVKGEGYVLPEEAKDMLLVLPNALGESYKDANLWHKSVSNVSDPALKEEDWIWFRVAKEPCVLLNGSIEKILVGYTTKVPPKGFAYMAECCLVPKKGVDVRYVAALLFEPSVKEQILTICDGNVSQRTLSLVLDKIIVPEHDEKERLSFLVETNELALTALREEKDKAFDEKLFAIKADYVNEVRMRKHDLRPHLRQLASAERLMLHYIEETSDIDVLKGHLKRQLNYSHEAIMCISAIVDHLCDEEQFGKAELVNIDEFLESIEINHNDSEGFAIEYNCDRESFRKGGFSIPDLIEKWEMEEKQGKNFEEFIQSQINENLPLFVDIAPVDFQRLIVNIIENARIHGFSADSTRTDYYVGIDLAYNSERRMYQIDFYNNGKPLPEGMTKERFGIRGEKAGMTGGSGIGGYIIKSIINHYGGDYDVFTESGITTIRIFLPISEQI